MEENELSTANKEKILNEITRFYLSSGDFNGIPALKLIANVRLEWKDIVEGLEELIEEENVCLLFIDAHINTHIMRLGYEAKEVQIAKLKTADMFHTCAYPLPKHLRKVVDKSQFEGKPYLLSLALGSPQLAYKEFDLSILEFYRNDPRYNYTNDGIQGHINISDDYFETEEMAESDQVLLDTFGFCYDENLNRAVAVYVRYLSRLSLEHQQIWKSKELEGDYELHPDYYRNTIIGDWGQKISIFDAFTEELKVVNEMANVMGHEPLFRKDFTQSEKPVEFTFLIRPTLKEYNDFVLLLDKMISDNINKKFFRNEVSYEYEEIRDDGKIVVRNKGTLQILDEWIRKHYRTSDWEPVDEMIKVFKQIRKERQKPAHAIKENVFSQKYFHKQRELIIRAYEGVRTLRLLFANHPLAAKIEIHESVRDGEIWTY